MWDVSYTNKFGNRHRPGRNGVPIDKSQSGSWGFNRGGASFEIRTYQGKVLYIDQKDSMALKVRNRRNNNEERFYFDAKSKSIRWVRNPSISIAAEFQQDGRYRLIGRKTTATSPEWFSKPGRGGIIMLTANKNYIWRASNSEGSKVTIVKGKGDRNWKANGTYF